MANRPLQKKSRILTLLAVLLLMLSGCDLADIWNNNLEGFIEKGWAEVAVSRYQFTRNGNETTAIYAGQPILLVVDISNPKNLELEYEIDLEQNNPAYFHDAPALTETSARQLHIAFSLSPAAEQNTITLLLHIRETGTSRRFRTRQFEFFCHQLPERPGYVHAAYDTSYNSYLEIELFQQPDAAHPENIEIEYRKKKHDTWHIGHLSISPDNNQYLFTPQDRAPGIAYIYRITVIDVNSMRSETLQTENYDLYTISYHPGASDITGTLPVDNTFYPSGAEIQLPGSDGYFSRPGYLFLGWATSSNATEAEYLPWHYLLIETADIDLYAVWQLDAPLFSYQLSLPEGTWLASQISQNNTLSISFDTAMDSTREVLSSTMAPYWSVAWDSAQYQNDTLTLVTSPDLPPGPVSIHLELNSQQGRTLEISLEYQIVAAVYYVDVNSAFGLGFRDNPFTNLQTAIDAVSGHTPAVVLVAEGEYKPGLARDVESVIVNMQEGISLYGGYQHGNWEIRDPVHYPSRLIDTRDYSMGSHEEDNPYRLVQFTAETTRDTIFDGFELVPARL